METLGKILGALAFIGLGFMLFRFIKSNPGNMLSKENVSQSFTTLGVLGLLLIALVGFAVMALRAG